MIAGALVYIAEPWMYEPGEIPAYYADLGVPYREAPAAGMQPDWGGAREATHLMIARSPMPAELFERLPRLRAVVKWGRGLERIDLGEASRRGVLVAYTPHAVQGVVEATLLLMLALSKHLPEQTAAAREGRPADSLAPGSELAGKTLGIIGYGAIGREVARIAQAFGMSVLVYTRSSQKHANAAGKRFVPLEELLTRSDYVSMHAAASPGEGPILTAEHIARIKPGAFFVNTARGGLVDEAAMLEALRAGGLAGAGLDVVAQEPIRPDDPLLALENVIVTPHALGITSETRHKIKRAIHEAFALLLAGQLPPYVANPEVTEAWIHENNFR